MYILLTKENTVAELIPDEDPVFPGVPIGARYTPEFISELLHVPNETAVEQNWVYDKEVGTFSPPPEPEPIPEPEPSGPVLEERVASLEAETAALTAAIERGLSL